MEWPAEARGSGALFIAPHTFITVGGVRTSDISDLDKICLMENSNSLNFDWVGYIRWGSDISDQRW
jgi:hypothetical protein